MNAEMDVTEDTPKLLGNIGLKLVLLPEIYIIPPPLGVNHILSNLVIIMLMDLWNLAPLKMEPLNALINVLKDILNYMPPIKLTDKVLIPLKALKIILKLNFSLTDPLKLLSLSMEISLHINLEFITMFLGVLLEDMLLK
jgi:hypothetical protein